MPFSIELIKDLVSKPGISGYEEPVKNFIEEKIKDYTRFYYTDGIGNLIARIDPSYSFSTRLQSDNFDIASNGPTILLTAHMDEIGMVVSHIEDDGSLRIRKVGMIDDRLLIGREIEVYSNNGTIPGVIGIRPPHLMPSLNDIEKKKYHKVPKWDELYVDIGTSSRIESEEMGITSMDPIGFKKSFLHLHESRIAARSLDDRIGCALLILVLENICKKTNIQSKNDKITFAWTVQEEIGSIGAESLSNNGRWDIVLVIDSYACADVPNVPYHFGPASLGKGPVIRMMDHYSISDKNLAKQAIKIAKKNGIPLQFGPTGGFTDGMRFQSKGSSILMLSFPIRYMHSPVEMADLNDLDNLFNLVVAFIDSILK
ncbi:MAG TPA: M42 family metallopeptidase [Halobacteria archaeon]|nr:M42 family metallopeptidase [Halobacteria archaeon]